MRTLLRYAAWFPVAACLLCFASRFAAAAPLEPAARVVAVTVFRDRAQVERETEVELPAGFSRITFVGLPAGLERDSVRASVAGAPVVLGAVEVVESVAPAEEAQDVKTLRAGIAQLRSELAKLDARDGTGAEQQKFLRAMADRAVAPPRPESPALDVASIDAFYRLMGARLEELSDRSLARGERRAALRRELELGEGRLAALERDSATLHLSVAVELEAEKPGARTLRVEYVVPGASWQPTYRASFDAETGKVGLISEAVVRQRTGDDWRDVSLRLSTATPARGLAPVQLPALWLRRRPKNIEEITVTARKREERLQDSPVRVSAVGNESAGPVDVVKATETPLQLNGIETAEVARETDVERAHHTVSFRVPGRSTIAADGRDHRVPLRRATLRATLEHRIVPAASPSAYVVAHAESPEYPLLAGPLRAYATDAYLGSLSLAQTAPRAKLDLPFGVDDRVRVERTSAPVVETASGLLGRQRQVEYRFVTRIENTTAEARAMVVEDRLPISEDERISVDLSDATSRGWRKLETRPGILEWPLELEPGEKREIVFGYSVRFPEGFALPRL